MDLKSNNITILFIKFTKAINADDTRKPIINLVFVFTLYGLASQSSTSKAQGSVD